MSKKDTAMTKAWLKAQEDLGIEVEIPFTIPAPYPCQFLGLVKHFGGPKGTILLSINDDFEAAFQFIASLGYYSSALNPLSYSKYDRVRFIETLDDWGWYGSREDKPDWYTGECWE
ncbi:MAG: hypothetical protein JXA21_19105 [Anaerolineae bacterium]|nr:hypothetical protein [Anaerolineae bacterium]